MVAQAIKDGEFVLKVNFVSGTINDLGLVVLFALLDVGSDQTESHVLVLFEVKSIHLGMLDDQHIVIKRFFWDADLVGGFDQRVLLELSSAGILYTIVKDSPVLQYLQDLIDFSFLISSSHSLGLLVGMVVIMKLVFLLDGFVFA